MSLHKIEVFYLIFVTIIINSNVNGQSQFIKNLISRMSPEDKCGQMTQISFDPVLQKEKMPNDPDENPVDLNKLLIAIRDKRIGSILQTPYTIATKAKTWQAIIKLIQDTALSYNLKIPIIYGLDSIHGANYIREGTLFPQPISMAASFNLDIVEKIARITAEETRAVGIPWNFNPAVDVGRQPLWPRIWEGYGESPFVGAKIAETYVKSHQGDNLANRSNTATCLKHYVGYSMPFNGRDRSPAYIPEYLLREIFLPPFEAGVLAGSPTVMVNSGEVNGMPGHANSFYINNILKGEMKFDGFVVSDWEDIKRLYTRDKIAESPEEAVRTAVLAGVDMSMVPFDYSFTDICVQLLKDKDQEFMDRVDDAVLRILKVKEKLGLWSNSSLYPDESDLVKFDSESSHSQNLEAARETIILAKNQDKILPLDKNANKRILVTGPTGNLMKCLNGGWTYTWQGDNEANNLNFGRTDKLTVFKAIQKKIFNGEVIFNEGVSFNDQNNNIQETVELAKDVDIIILTVGEATYTETPGNINNLLLNKEQYDLANALFGLNKKVILIYLGGRPRVITQMANKADAVILGFLPGNRGGEAIADIIFGEYNPNGRLPITYPLSTNGFMTYDRKNLEVYVDTTDPLALSRGEYENLFPFGHGLSYTEFRYSSLTLSSSIIQYPDEKVTVSIDIQNTGDRDGKEVVILYLQDEFSSISRPVREVKGFEKIFLKTGETKKVSFDLKKEDFTFINQKNQRVAEEGSFKVYINNFNETATFNLKVGATPQNIFSKLFQENILSKFIQGLKSIFHKISTYF